MSKAAQAFRTISEVAEELDIPKHVLRFWELKFPQIKPMKRGGGRRYYRPEDVDLLRGIRHLLHAEGYTIKGVQKILREQGVDTVKTLVADSAVRGAKSAEAKGKAAKKPGKRSSAELVRQKLAAKAIRGRGEAGPVDAPPSLKNVIDGAIAELRACRSLLEGARQTSTASKKKSTATRSSRRARAASN